MDFLKHLSESLGQMSGVLTFLFLIIALFMYFQKDSLGRLMDRIRKKEKERKIEILLFHNMFITAESVLHKISDMDFTTYDTYDATKTKLLKKLIELKIATIKIRFSEFLKRPDLDDIEPNQLKFIISAMLSSLVNEYNDNALKIMVEEYGISQKDAAFLIRSYEDFRTYIVEAFIDELQSIVLDDNYDNNFERINTILYTVSISLHVIPRDVVGAFNEVNGRFKKYNKKKN